MDKIDKLAQIISNSNDLLGKKMDKLTEVLKKRKAPVVNTTAPLVNVDVPDVIIPEIEMPKIQIPEIKAPKVVIPDINLPDIKIPEIKVPKITDVSVNNLKDIDIKPIVSAIENLYGSEIDYTLIYNEMMRIMESPNNDIKDIIEIAKNLSSREDISDIIHVLREIADRPKGKYKGGRLLVAVDKAGGGGQLPFQANTKTVYNVTMTDADTEYSQAIPNNAMQIQFRCRGLYDVRHSFTTGKVATPTSPYETLRAGMTGHEDKLILNSKTLYFACGDAGQVLELAVWT